mgnify:CR=1 FL=1|jgi:hypothetical protein
MRTIGERLKPTLKNVTEKFVTDTMYKLIFDKTLPNFNFDFREPEAINFIEYILKRYCKKYNFYHKESSQIIEHINSKDFSNENPVMIIHNYQDFFELLRQYYEQNIELYFQRTGYSGFPCYEQTNCFEQIWLRATPEDFTDPEQFLRKGVSLLKDHTLDKYNKETCIGKLSRFDDNPTCVQNKVARTWDENSKEFQITIYDKRHYNNMKLFNRPHYSLPVIRYGIYEKNGKKICHIGSIQDKKFSDLTDENLRKYVNESRKCFNKGKLRSENFIEKVEPEKLLSLGIFINILNKEGVYEIETPGLLVLDYDYHTKRGELAKANFDIEWNEYKKKKCPDTYQRDLKYLSMNYNMQDTISEIKTERLLYTIKRLLSHYPNGKIKSFPGDVDSFLRLTIPPIKQKSDINGAILQEMFSLVNNMYLDQSR